MKEIISKKIEKTTRFHPLSQGALLLTRTCSDQNNKKQTHQPKIGGLKLGLQLPFSKQYNIKPREINPEYQFLAISILHTTKIPEQEKGVTGNQ